MGDLTDREYLDALAFVQSAARENGIDAVLERDELDALIGPTRGPAWVIDSVNGDPRTGGGNGMFSAVSGYPHLTVPMGRVHGLPVGISFMGAAHSDAKLLEIGEVFERASGRLSLVG